ncbi:myosin-9-like [Scaptodrosophila lebanonensis]|uniref:Myosin-9-like n=1 Tax=Drosophila lebanonensis TaxID=7225 RepID=A0A6J2TZ13_DROLE|nr:myosin-9-like [Scaptodrosophila lebanonensis]
MDHFAILEIKYDYTVAKHDSIKCQQNEYLAFEQKRIEDFTEMIANQRKLQEDAIASNTYLVQNHSERVAALKKQSENLQVDGKNLVATVQSKKQAYDQKLTECAKLNKESEVQLQNELKNIDMTFAEYRERSKLKIIEGAGLISKLNDNLKEKTLNYQSLKDNHQSLVAQLDKSSQNNALEIEKFEKKLNEFNTLIATNKESYEKELQNIRDLSMQMALQRKNEIAVWQEKKMENTRQIHQISQQLEKLEEKKGKLVDLPTKENEYIRQLKARKELQMLRICDIQEQLQKMDEIIDDLSQNQHHMKINVVKPISYLRETTAILGQLNGQQVESVSTRTDTIQALPEAVITDHPRNSEVIAVDKDSVDLETDSEGETPSPKLPPIDMPSQEEDVKPFNKPAERAIVTDVKIICRGSSLRESAPIISPPSKQQLESASVSADTANVKFNVVYKDFIDLDSESDVGTSSPKLSQQQKDVNQFDNPTEHAVVTTVDKICESSLGKTEATISALIEQQVQSASADTIEDVPYVACPNHPQKTKRGGTFDDYSEFESESDFDIPPPQFRPLKRRRRHAIQNLSLYS